MSYSTNFYLDKQISQRKIFETKTTSKSQYNKMMKRVANQPLQIFLYFRYSGRTIKIYTERKCTQKQWDFEKQKVNPNYFRAGASAFNEYLEKILNEVGRIYEENNNKSILTTKDHLKTIVYGLNGRSKSQIPLTFEDIFLAFIKNAEINKQPSTIKCYRTTFNHLKYFSKRYKGSLNFEKIDFDFESSLRKYFIDDAKLTNNTIAKNFKVLKTFLNYCSDRGHIKNLLFKKFVATEVPKEVYTLTLEELQKLYMHGFEDERLGRVRDVFCFSCFTGLRFSDVLALRRENIQNSQLRITTRKTQEDLSIPLNYFALEILKKYETFKKPLPVISSQKTNQYLKEIGRLLEFNDMVKMIKYRGAERIEEYYPKHVMLTFHIARKTFITSSLVLGMNDRVVREFSGHKKEESFRRYVKFADEYKRRSMSDAWNKDTLFVN